MPTPIDDQRGRLRAGAALVCLVVSLPVSVRAQHRTLDRLLRFLGVTIGPGQTKSPGDGPPGRLFIKDLPSGTERPLTTEGGYRWPVFSLDGKSVFTLSGDQLVTVDVASGKTTRGHKLAKVDKLVGVDREQPDQMLVLRTDPAAPIGLLSIKTGKITPLPYDPHDAEQTQMLGHLAGEERTYGTTRVFVETESKPTIAGNSEWKEIYLQSADAPPRPISACAGKNCREPALSANGNQAVWIRVGG